MKKKKKNNNYKLVNELEVNIYMILGYTVTVTNVALGVNTPLNLPIETEGDYFDRV